MLRKTIKVVDKGIDRIVLIVSLLFFLICIYAMIDAVMVYYNANDQSVLKFKPHGKEEAAVLRELSDDAVAWLTVDGTHIDYPVMQGKDNSEYLNKDPYGDYALSGSIFLDSRCDGEFKDAYSLLYGHHMDYGSMFSDLCNYTSRMFRDTHQDILFETHTAKESYKVFAVLRVKADDYWYNFIDAETAKKFDKKISYAKEHSLYKTNITPEFGQKLLTLSTCMGSNRDDRLIVIAVKNQK